MPRDQHNISRKNISQPALKVLYRLHEAGFAAFLVGGAVRDLLLGGHPKDFDIATDATPEQVRGLFRNCRLIGRRFRLAHVLFGREVIEVATFRGTGEEGDGDRHLVDGRIVRDNIWGSIEEDAIRRDFRINALYYDIADFSVRDYVDGMQDLQQRVLRLIGDPEQRYREDPVRMLRAVRIAAKLDFSIDPEAAEPLESHGELLAEAAPARLFDESLKLLLAGRGSDGFRLLERERLLPHLFPGTAHAIERDPALRGMIETGLRNTDQRVAEGKPVTPAFLFALLLWGEVSQQAARLQDDGQAPAVAWQKASRHAIGAQTQRVAIPRRFAMVMEEIWALQSRFEQRTRKRVFRLMGHPRFRAAYDFLLLRAYESEHMAELGRWWTRAQELQENQLAEELAGGSPAARKSGNRRRRRRRKPPADGSD